MAKLKSSNSQKERVSFGVKKTGVKRKKRNKHDKSEKNYRGQGRK
jgi:hypothetical protein